MSPIMSKIPAPKRYFKIRSKTTGLYRKTGAGRQNWAKNGKIWTGTGPLRQYINLCSGCEWNDIQDWEVVELEMKEVCTKEVYEMIDIMKILRKK